MKVTYKKLAADNANWSAVASMKLSLAPGESAGMFDEPNSGWEFRTLKSGARTLSIRFAYRNDFDAMVAKRKVWLTMMLGDAMSAPRPD